VRQDSELVGDDVEVCHMRQLFWHLVCLVMGLSCAAIAQTDALPQFEVASIKPSAPDERQTSIRLAPGRANVTNATLKELISSAWRIEPFRISGGPAWLDSARYDISAKSGNGSPKRDETLPMLQSLLTDRFQLKIQRGTKELPIYALAVAKNGKLGPWLTESKPGSCKPYDPATPPTLPEPGNSGRGGRGNGGSSELPCGSLIRTPRGLTAASVPVADLIPTLMQVLGRTVADKTGLIGNFDIMFEWIPDAGRGGRNGRGDSSLADSSGPSIFTLIQEQLGLKLVSERGPVEIFMIERAEKPSEN
jgi:uncharacterized protein (TIGR03435 family)